MATVTVYSDFGAQKEEICLYFHHFPSICHVVMGLDDMILVYFLLFILKPVLSLSITLIKRL